MEGHIRMWTAKAEEGCGVHVSAMSARNIPNVVETSSISGSFIGLAEVFLTSAHVTLLEWSERRTDVLETSLRRIQDVIQTSPRRHWDVSKTSYRRHRDVMQTSFRRYRDILETSCRRLSDVIKTSVRRLQNVIKTYWRRFQNVLQTSPNVL